MTKDQEIIILEHLKTNVNIGIPFIQRKFGVNYAKAAEILAQLTKEKRSLH